MFVHIPSSKVLPHFPQCRHRYITSVFLHFSHISYSANIILPRSFPNIYGTLLRCTKSLIHQGIYLYTVRMRNLLGIRRILRNIHQTHNPDALFLIFLCTSFFAPFRAVWFWAWHPCCNNRRSPTQMEEHLFAVRTVPTISVY